MENNTVENKLTLTRKDLNTSYMLWICTAQCMYNYERMMANGMVAAMYPAIQRFYKDNPEEIRAACMRHMEFFNTEVWLTGPALIGLVLSLEEQRANGMDLSDDDINAVKTSLMGPAAGIGDTLRQATLIPIIGSIAISISLSESFFGPIFYMIATLLINYGISYNLFNFSYIKGKEGIGKLFASGKLEEVMTMATVVGAICLGGLAATTVKISSSMVLDLGSGQLAVQDLLDKIILNLLPMGILGLTYYLMQKKKISSVKILLILTSIATIGVLVGFI